MKNFQKGQGLAEYVLAVTVVVVIIFVAFTFLGPIINNMYEKIYSNLPF